MQQVPFACALQSSSASCSELDEFAREILVLTACKDPNIVTFLVRSISLLRFAPSLRCLVRPWRMLEQGTWVGRFIARKPEAERDWIVPLHCNLK